MIATDKPLNMFIEIETRRFPPIASVFRTLFTLAFFSTAILGVGCEPAEKIGTVTGKVTYLGKPVTTGSVVFENVKTGDAVMATLQPDGSFVAVTFDRAGLLVGRYRVAITPSQIGTGEFAAAVDPSETAKKEPPAAVPVKYHTSSTSGLTADVGEGENPPFVINLTE